MKSRMKLLMLFSLLVLVAALTVATTYAWFMFNDSTGPIVITTGTIEVNASLYVENQDNNPKNNGTYDEYTDWKRVNTEFSFTNCSPGEIYVFKLVVKNSGTLDGHLKVALRNVYISNGHNENDILNSLNAIYLNPTIGDDSFVTKNFKDNVVLEEVIDDKNYYRLEFFEGYQLDSQDTIDLYFKVEIIGSVTDNNTLMGYTLTIGNVYVELKQIH